MEASAVPREAPSGAVGILSPRVLRMAPDARLVAWVREGRSAAFDALYNRHHKPILSFCHHMLGSLEEAEDAVQHTFLAAYNGLGGSERPIHLRAWLFTIARNRCYSVLRKRRDQPLAECAEPATEGLATLVQRRQDLRDLVLDMRRLPDEQRAALVLAAMDSLSHEQIGDVLGVPTVKVKALVFQARESLLASRSAREADCAEIREQLANLRGGALRRAELRRHLRDCTGCREFRKQLGEQRRQLRVLIPVAPAVALKHMLLSAGGGGAAAGGVAGGGFLTSSSIKGATLVGAVLAGVGAAGTIVAVRGLPEVWPAHSVARHAQPAGTSQAVAVKTARPAPARQGTYAAARGGSSTSRSAAVFASLAFSRSHQLAAHFGHVKGSSAHLVKVRARSGGHSGAAGRASTGLHAASRATSSPPASTGILPALFGQSAGGYQAHSEGAFSKSSSQPSSADSGLGQTWSHHQESTSASSPASSGGGQGSSPGGADTGHSWQPSSGSGDHGGHHWSGSGQDGGHTGAGSGYSGSSAPSGAGSPPGDHGHSWQGGQSSGHGGHGGGGGSPGGGGWHHH